MMNNKCFGRVKRSALFTGKCASADGRFGRTVERRTNLTYSRKERIGWRPAVRRRLARTTAGIERNYKIYVILLGSGVHRILEYIGE